MMKMLSDSIATVARHYRQGTLNWPMIIYISLAHVAAIIGLFTISKCHPMTLLWAFILWPISGVGITGGVHRLWAHRSYKASFPLRVYLMLANSIANQGSIWHWSRDHRVHHKHSETDADPHNATRGIFFAHMGWLFVKKHKDVIEAGKKLNFDDLAEDPVVMFQKTFDPWFALFMCFVFPGLVCTLWGDNFWNGYWVAGALRYIYVLHVTWLVNSAAHFFGDHPYDANSWPAENPIVSFLAVGEGWHNWHHKYPFDYAASEFGVDKQYNPTKLFIDICCSWGLASDRKRATGAWSKLKATRSKQD
jgi:stearoyl-CoA desaturase (delta-9 desaturase)